MNPKEKTITTYSRSILVVLFFSSLALEHTPAIRGFTLLFIFLIALYDQKNELKYAVRDSISIILWMAFCCLSYFWSLRPDATIFHIKNDLIPPLLGFLSFYTFAFKKHNEKILSAAIVAMSIANFSCAFLGFFLKKPSFLYYYADVGFSSTIALFGLVFSAYLKSIKKHVFLCRTIMLLNLLTGLISGNRMFILASGILFTPLIINAIIQYRFEWGKIKHTIYSVTILLISIGALLSLGQNNEGVDYIISKTSTLYSPSDTRLKFWGIWIDFANQTSWFGSGFGRNVASYSFARNNSSLIAIDPLSVMHSHNLFIQSYVEVGLIGTVLFLAMLVNLYKKIFQNPDSSVMLGGSLLLTAFILKNQTDIFTIYATQLLFFSLLGYFLGKIRCATINMR